MSGEANGKHDKDGDKEDEKWVSYAAEQGEWTTRQISVMGVVKRFITNLSYGQEITKVSMPSEFLNPFSVLEFVSLRYLTRFPILIEANTHSEPHYRMLHVIRWFLSSLVNAKMYKKPYNPVVGETHSCFIEDNGGITQFIGEQVSHHPPVSAMHLRNDDAGVSLQGTISFGVKFWLNSVTVNTSGYVTVNLAKHGDEEYNFQKALPDLNLKNVVFGTRRMRWQGSLEIYCAKTNCEAEITFNQSGNDETLTGSISRDGETLITFEGSLENQVTYQDESQDEEHVLFTAEQPPVPTIIIPPQTDQYPSLKVWKEVSKHIIANNMTEADKAKTVVEDEQRVRTRAGEDEKKDRKYFTWNEEMDRWVYKDGTFQVNQHS